MATQARSGINRWLLGSVAKKFSGKRPIRFHDSCKISEPEDAPMFKSLIVPLDKSDLAERVLPSAMEMAEDRKLEIVLIRTDNIPTTAYYPVEGYALSMDDLLKGMREEGCEYLGNKVADVKKLAVAECLTRPRKASPRMTLAKTYPEG